MNITLTNIDPVNAIIKLDIVQADYAENTEKELKKLRQKASVPGFRVGMAPIGYIKKMYEKSIIAEQINKIVSDNLYKYLRENKLNVLGEPLPNETEQKTINFDTDVDFEFCFDVAIAPVIELKLTKRDKLPYYLVEVSEEQLNEQIESYKANYGTYDQADQIEGKDMAKGLLTELDETGKAKRGGIELYDNVLMPSFMKDEEEKAKFMKAKKGDIVTFNPYKAYEGSAAELASFLRIHKDFVYAYQNVDFSFEVNEITRYMPAELNQDLFDKIFDEGTVKTVEEFTAKVKDRLSSRTKPDSDYRFLLDARKLLDKRTGEVIFPETFLKRWLLSSDEKRSPESLEEDFPKIIEDLKFHLIKEQIIKDNGFKVDEADLNAAAKTAIKVQFATAYGMDNVSETLLEEYAKEMLKKEKNIRNLVDKVLEDKFVEWLKGKITLQEKEISIDEFRKLFE